MFQKVLADSRLSSLELRGVGGYAWGPQDPKVAARESRPGYNDRIKAGARLAAVLEMR